MTTKETSAFEFNTEIRLRDGESAEIHAAKPTDKDGILSIVSKLNNASLNYRFFKDSKVPSAEQVTNFLQPDVNQTIVLVLTVKQEGQDKLVGFGRYACSEEEAHANVALAVAPKHHGRGIGTALLECLASIASQRGIKEFGANVLGEDNHLIRMASKTGLPVSHYSKDGRIHMSLSIQKTEEFVSRSLQREISAAAKSIENVLEPKTVAVIGASRRRESISGALFNNIIKYRFNGQLYPVNPKAEEIEYIKCYPSVAAIGKPIDLAFIVVPSRFVEAALKDCAESGVKAVVVISSGFAEMSDDGRKKEEELTNLVRQYGMRMVGPNCMGIFNTDPDILLNATFAPGWPPEGNVGFLSQSGALGVAILDYAKCLNIGVSSFVSVGNKADVSGNDLLCYWAENEKTDVIALYLESFGNPRKFGRIAPEIARKKPIIAVKSGRTAAGSRAAQSHSASLASLDVAVDALFEQAGVIRTNTLEGLFDVLSVLSTQPIPKGNRVGVVTNAGGPGILLADSLEANGMVLPVLSDKTIDALNEYLPPEAGLANPIDMIASATHEHFEKTIEIVGNDESVDSVIVIYVSPRISDTEDIGRGIAMGAGKVPDEKPVITVFLTSRGAPEVLGTGPRGKLPAFSFPENASRALKAAVAYGAWKRKEIGKVAEIEHFRKEVIRSVVDKALVNSEDGSVWLSQKSLAVILEAIGVEMATAETVALDKAVEVAEQMGYPLVMKAISPGLLHKSDVGGVILDLNSKEEVAEALKDLKDKMAKIKAPLEAVLLQRQITGGIEAFIGVTTDPTFGPLLVCGVGGVQVEIIKDVSFRLPPVTDVDAREMLMALRSKKLLEGYRGSPAGDVDALVSIIMKISALLEVAPEISELDLNPVKVLEPGSGAISVDGRMRLAKEEKR